MKKFLLLLVGVLFALSAKAANYTFYIDIQNTGWNSAPYVYLANTSHEYWSQYQADATPVKGSIYKITFSWDNLKYVAFSNKSGLIKEDHTLNVSSTDWGQTIYGELDGNDATDHRIESGALYVLNPNNGSTNTEKNKFSVTSNYDPNATDPGESTVVYKYSGDETSWNNEGGAKELALTGNGDGTYSLTRTFANNKNFGIREYTNGKQTAWYYGVKDSNTISTVGQTYNAVTSGGSNWNFQLTAGEYTLTFNPTAKTIVFTSTSDPTPTVETAYTIYFDTFQSRWRNVTLLNDGVEVVGSLVKTGYIHGAKEDGVEGYLHKYTVNTTDATKLTFTNGTASYTLSTITDGNVYYVSESGLADAALASYKVNAELSYRFHGQILGNDSWDTYKMTYFDGLWICEADNFVAGNFGIKKLGKDEAVDKSASSSNPWIYAKTMTDNAHHVVIGAATNCALQGSEQATDNSGNFYSSVTGKKTLVFDPEAMTIMFINPVAATATATVEPVSTTSHANKLSLTINVSDYSSVTGGYALSNGTFTAVSTDGTFTNVPYASNYTLTVGSTSMPINISMPAEPTFNITAVNAEVLAPADGQINGILSVTFPVTTTWSYNLPHVICTSNGAVVPGEVIWAEGGFAFVAAEAVPLRSENKIADNMTFKFVITPEYPFMVNAASTRGQMRVSGTGYQTVLGTAITDAEAKLTGGSDVSGIEGVVIEAEDAPVEYFNLQGQRVNGDLAPGIYIRRQGTTVTKVRI